VVGLVEIGLAVIGRHVESALVVEDALHPLRNGEEVHLAQVLAGIQAVLVEVAAAVLADPGAHPHCALVAVNADTGNLFLSGRRLELESALEFQGLGVMNGNLDVLAHAVHEVFGADENFPVEDVDVADMVGRNGVAFKGILVAGDELSGLVVLVQGLAVAHVVELAV